MVSFCYSLLGKPGGESNLMPTALAIGASIAMLVVLALFRGAVGPMRASKAKTREPLKVGLDLQGATR